MPTSRTFPLKYPGWFEKRQNVRRELDHINPQIRNRRPLFGALARRRQPL